MKAIMIMFDSLARKFLPPYGNTWVKAPNFERLAEHSVTFDKCFVGSMPCMPARRELHTGRYNFLHRSWGPLEPFDVSMPEILKKNGTYTHLVSDHYHYWEDGGSTYHNRFSSWESVRGQEGDFWKAEVGETHIPDHLGAASVQDQINRKYIKTEEDTTTAQTFRLGLDFLEQNHKQDNWFLQIECFDPHPPYFVPEKYQKLYPDDYDGPLFDWPRYGAVDKEKETPQHIRHMRNLYAALVSMCDHYLGTVLQFMDDHRMWDDTLLILTTDHGFLLGEHDWWAFCRPPFYDDVSVKPLFIWDPRCGRKGERNGQMVQTHDIPATLLEYFGVERPQEMQGVPLAATVASGQQAHEYGLFGVFGGHVNISDGRYVYMRAPIRKDNQPLHQYTLMPVHMRAFFSTTDLQGAKLHPPFDFTRGMPLLQTEGKAFMQNAHELGNLLFDLETDPEQKCPIRNPEIESRMIQALIRLMKENDAPSEQFERLGLLPVV